MQHIQIENLEETQELLLKIDKKIKDTKPLMANISEHLYNVVSQSFEEEKSPDGIAWTPIKIRTIHTSYQKKGKKTHTKKGVQTKAFQRYADKKRILYDEGEMQKKQYKKHDSNSATIGFNAVSNDFQYPLTHQFGTNKAGRNKNITIVARPFMPIHKDGSLYEGTKKEIFQIVDDYMDIVLK